MLFVAGLIVLIVIIVAITSTIEYRKDEKAKQEFIRTMRGEDENKISEENIPRSSYNGKKDSRVGEIITIVILGAIFIAIMIGIFLAMDVVFAGF